MNSRRTPSGDGRGQRHTGAPRRDGAPRERYGRPGPTSRGPREDRDDTRDRRGRRDQPPSRARYGKRDDGRGDRAPRGRYELDRRDGWYDRDEVLLTIGGLGDRPRGGDRARSGRDRAPDRAPSRASGRASDRTPSAHRPSRPSSGRPARGAAAAGPSPSARRSPRDPESYPEGPAGERDTTEVPDGIRLQKVLAQAGIGSRRACEEMIGQGRVTVDGQVVRRFGARVDPARQVIHVDGKRIPTAPDLVYLAINKPIGVVSTMSDPEGRPSLADYVADRPERLFHVGRLDTETEGLILLTNDGELANRLTHPSYGVPKKYWAKVAGRPARGLGRRLREGVELEDGPAKADAFRVIQEHGQQALVEIVLHEGRKHIVRRMLEAVGHPVIDLARIEFGPVKLGRLKPGTVRALTVREVGELYAAVGL